MRTDDIVARIRDLCPGFARVDHALTSTFDEVQDSPAAFVSLVEAMPRPNAEGRFRSMLIGVHSQTVDLTVGVFIQLRRTQDDDAGEGANDDLDTLRGQLHDALVTWQPAGVDEPFAYAGGRLVERNGLVAWREEFATSTELRR